MPETRLRDGLKFCECGCGEQIPTLTVKGKPARFVHHHNVRMPRKKPGDTYLHKPTGYVFEYAPDHPKAHNGYVLQHVLVWERMTGQVVPKGYLVHHRNGIKTDNHPENLEAMPRGKHQTHHMLQRSREEIERMHAAAMVAAYKNGTATPRPYVPCATCGKMFKQYNKGMKCCSRPCAWKLRRTQAQTQ